MNATQLIDFSETDAGLAELAAKYMPLIVASPDDDAGYQAAKAARIDVKTRRVQVEKKRVELKAGALEYGRKVDGEPSESPPRSRRLRATWRPRRPSSPTNWAAVRKRRKRRRQPFRNRGMK